MRLIVITAKAHSRNESARPGSTPAFSVGRYFPLAVLEETAFVVFCLILAVPLVRRNSLRLLSSPSLCLFRHCHRALLASMQGARAAFLCDVTCLFPLTEIKKKAGSYRPFSSYIFFDFIIPISMALFMCSLHPAMSFATLRFCRSHFPAYPSFVLAIRHLHKHAICLIHVLLMQDAIFIADAGAAAKISAAIAAALTTLEIIVAPQMISAS